MALILPKLKVWRSLQREKELVQTFRDKVEGFTRTVDSPIHVSDILEPRKAYWQRIDPRRIDDVSVKFFNLGYAGHEYLLGQDDEGGTTKDDICWSPDKRTESTIIEVKITTKKQIMLTLDELEKYLQQILAYMCLEEKFEGEIWVWYVAAYSCPELVVYRVSASKYALAKYRRQVRSEAKKLRGALQAQDHTSLALCTRSFCYRSKCVWYDKCKPEGRWKPKKEEV